VAFLNFAPKKLRGLDGYHFMWHYLENYVFPLIMTSKQKAHQKVMNTMTLDHGLKQNG
jgi:hypothetical protein